MCYSATVDDVFTKRCQLRSLEIDHPTNSNIWDRQRYPVPDFLQTNNSITQQAYQINDDEWRFFMLNF